MSRMFRGALPYRTPLKQRTESPAALLSPLIVHLAARAKGLLSLLRDCARSAHVPGGLCNGLESVRSATQLLNSRIWIRWLGVLATRGWALSPLAERQRT